MARPGVRVTSARRSSAEVPEQFTEFVALLLFLREQGLLDGIERHVRLHRRSDACTGLDVVLFLLCAWCVRAPSLRDLHEQQLRAHGPKLAAVAGRERLPSCSALSAALKACQRQEADDATEWLLRASVVDPALIRDPSAAYHDTVGQPWYVFDWDPTVDAFRERMLPEGDDLPPGQRRLRHLAKPGYAGRKRGEVQRSRATLQYAGTAHWVHVDAGRGNGDPRSDIERAAAAAQAWSARFELPPDRLVFRFDGGNSGVPSLTACRQAGLVPLTRLHAYHLLEDPDVRAHLAVSCWQEVEDSGSGPRRMATELGTVQIVPSKHTTRRDDGQAYEPLSIRVVVSRCPAEQALHGAGKVLGPWRYELFGTDLPAEGWPASETVTAYYARSAEENRFAQEDRELGLDRQRSHFPAGQQLACAVGLFLWNLRLSLGAQRLGGWPTPRPEPSPRRVVEHPADEGFEESGQQASAAAGAGMAGQTATTAKEGSAPAAPCPGRPDEKQASQTADVDDARVAAVCADRDTVAHKPGAVGDLALAALVCGVPAAAMAKLPGLSWDDEQTALLCPSGQPMRRHGARVVGSQMETVWRAQRSSCRRCPRRPECTSSQSPSYQRQVSLLVPLPEGVEPAEVRPVAPRPSPSLPAPPRWRSPEPTAPGAYALRSPSLVPTELRRAVPTQLVGARVEVRVRLRSRPRRRPRHLAETAGERQHRRKTWRQRRCHRALPAGSRVWVGFRAYDDVPRSLLERLGIACVS